MKEFQVTVRFDEEADDLMDLFHEYPSLRLWTSACQVSQESMWRIDQVTGSEVALGAFDGVYLDDRHCNECLDGQNCETTREYRVLSQQPSARTVYTYRSGVSRCSSVPASVVDHVGDGVVFESQRTGDAYHWRVLSPVDSRLDSLFDEIESTLKAGLDLEIAYCNQSPTWDASVQPPFET